MLPTDSDLSAPIQAQNEFYRHLVENSLGLICAHDLTGQLLTVNAEAARLLEYEPAQLVGRNIGDLVDPEVKRLFAHYLHRISTRGQANGELRLMKKSGGVVTWYYRNSVYRESGSKPVVIGHALDITRHLQMEEKLMESTERYRALFEDAPVAYHEINRDGVIVRVNRAECELLGWNKEELLGRPVWELISSGQKATSEIQVKRKLSGAQPLAPFIREYIRKTGEKLTLLIHENLITSRSGVIVGIRSTLLDVSEQVRAEAELRQINSELDARIAERTKDLEKSNRRLNEFVHVVSHDLREPLRSVSSFSSLLRQRYLNVLGDEGTEFLNHVIAASARMTALIEDLLSLSRVSEGDFATAQVDLNQALGAALENLSQAIETGHAQVKSERLPMVAANFTQMMQLFQNLIENALKYRSQASPSVQIRARREGAAVIVSVADNGIGIPEGEQQKIFTAFQRASNAQCEGTGIGLAICQSIVERHGGRIWVEGNPDGLGTTFNFSLRAERRRDARS